jgi:TonB-linked SusC/RagA family outer membrane protein
MRKLLYLLLMQCFLFPGLYAQVKSVKGLIRDEKGEPVAGATIVLKGTKKAVASNAEGEFTIGANKGDVLVITAVSIEKVEVTVGDKDIVEVNTISNKKELSEVVVSAPLGQKKLQKALSYASQQINADRLTQTREPDLNSALAGKIAGVQVQSQSGAALGRTASVRLRGVPGFYDKNPIYVVDGTILPDGSDINTDDVESINVLKGPNATAIYGQRADGGVIVITTKKGKKKPGLGFEFNHTITAEQVANLPEFQNDYAGGSNYDLEKFNWSAAKHPQEWKALDGKYFHNYGGDESWGPRMAGQEYIPWYAWYPGHDQSYKTTSLVPQKNNIKQFYETGLTVSNNLNWNKNWEKVKLRLSYTNLSREGIIPNSSQRKNTFSIQNSIDITSRLTLGVNATYVAENLKGEFNDGYSNQSSGSFNQWFHRNVDMNLLKKYSNLKSPDGKALATWNLPNPNSDYSADPNAFYQGVYWVNYFSFFDQVQNTVKNTRLFGDVNLSYKITSNLKATVFYRTNRRKVLGEERYPYIFETSGPQVTPFGKFAGYRVREASYDESNYELLLSYNKKIGKFDIDVNAGGNILNWKENDSTQATANGLKTADVFKLDNSVGPVNTTYTYGFPFRKKSIRSAYVSGNIGYDNFLYLNFSSRTDWSSALPANKNYYTYPSVGLSFIFSEFVRDQIPALSFGKLRFGVAQVGTDLDPYRLNLNYTTANNPFGGSNPVQFTGNVSVDPNIKPAINTSFEGGIDLKFFKNKIGLSATYYKETRKNEIVAIPVAAASGFTSSLVNAGEQLRKGIELSLDVSLVSYKNFKWDITFNGARNTAEVIKITDDSKQIPLPLNAGGGSRGDAFAFAIVSHREGQAWGQLVGSGIARNAQGVPILDAAGFFTRADDLRFGSVLPEFTGGIFNNISIGKFFVTASIDFQKGSKFFSLSDMWGTYSGLYKKTVGLNDKGIPVRDAVADGGGVRVDGVDDNDKPVSFYVPAKDYYKQFGNNNIADFSILDGSFVKLREVSIGYKPTLKNTRLVKNIYVSLVARNPLLIYSGAPGFDPSELSGRFGENGQFPGTRSIGVNLRLGF